MNDRPDAERPSTSAESRGGRAEPPSELQRMNALLETIHRRLSTWRLMWSVALGIVLGVPLLLAFFLGLLMATGSLRMVLEHLFGV